MKKFIPIQLRKIKKRPLGPNMFLGAYARYTKSGKKQKMPKDQV